MKRRVHRYVPSAPPLRAVARPRELSSKEWWLAALRVIAALLAPFVLLALAGCDTEFKGEKVDYGPAEHEDKVMGAIVDMWRDSHPENTKVGAFVHFATTQNVSNGAFKATVSDTGHTVVDRVESADTITLSVVEIKYSYRENQPAEKLLRQFELAFAKEGARIATLAKDHEMASTMLKNMSAKARATAKLQAEDDAPPMPTYHHLKVWEVRAPPPEAVRTKPNCMDIPGCLITYRHVSVDLVYWDKPEGNRLAIELVTSPDIPQTIGYNMSRVNTYIPGLVKSCLSQMVEVGDGGGTTLVSECQEVLSFQFE